MTIHHSFTNWVFRVCFAFFAAVCVFASVYAYADDTVFLYYDDVFKTSGTDVGAVLNSGYPGYTLKITGPATHNEHVLTKGLTINGVGEKRKVNVQSSDPNVPVYAFSKNDDRLQFTMTDIEYCGNAYQNVRSVFLKDEYTGTSSNSMTLTFYNVTISSFNAPDSEVCSVINNSNAKTTITLCSEEDITTTFSNNRGCINTNVINFNAAGTDSNAPTGDWRFINNYADNGSAMYFRDTFLKNGGKYTFTENSAVYNGGAVYSTVYYNTTSISQSAMCYLLASEIIIKFENNTAGEKGGAICGKESEIRVGGENTFKNNRAGIGLDGNLLSNNIASGKGGAICCETSVYDDYSFKLGYVFISDGPSTFESNLAYGDGGAIYSEGSVDIRDVTSSKYYKNVAGFGNDNPVSGGAIYSFQYTYIKDSPSEFSENSATNSGGAIYCESFVRIWESPSEFSKNSAANSGGAIYSCDYTYIRGSSTEFSENSAANSGGAIYSEWRVYFNNSPLTVSDNKAYQGGAIYSPYVEFYGADGSATFTGNYGNFNNNGEIDYACGNDVYCPVNDHYSPREGDVATNLGFSDAGAYSFDGGIYIEYSERDMYEDDPYNTAINQAQVTIAGRANDSTNYYQFRRASISNGGKLTANLDEIEGVNGIITMDNTAKLELNVTGANPKKLTMNAEDFNAAAQDNDLAVQGSGVIEKTGDGTLQILAEAEGLVCAESFVVSSGRLDYRGYFTGAVEVGDSEAEAIFSPGNSVGDAYVEGNVKIRNSGIALFEFGTFPGRDSDSNHDVLYITNEDYSFSAGDQRISLLFEYSLAEDWSYEGCKYLLVSGANLPGGDYTSWLDGDFTGLFSLLSEENNLYLVYPLPEPLPEPSTIALLALGVVVLFLRKRVRN